MKIYRYIVIFLTAIVAIGCSQYLQENPKSELPHEDIISDATSLYRNTVNSLYNHIGSYQQGEGLQGTYRGVYDLQTFTSDEAIIPTRGGDWLDGGLWQELFLHTYTADNEVIENAWNYLYKVVALCNLSLDLIDQYKNLLTQEQFTAYNAEVRAVRALYYFYLTDLFGNIPLITATNVSMQSIEQSTRNEAFDFVWTELETVADLLSDEMSQKQGTQYGHITQPVAYFILMKMALNSEVWTGETRYAEVVKYADLIEAAGYHLTEKQQDCFGVYNENCEENIFTIPMDKQLYRTQFCNQFRSLHYQHGSALGYGGENGSSATIEALKAFGYGTEHEDSRFRTTYFADTVYVNSKPLVLSNSDTLIYKADAVRLDLTSSKYIATAGARMYKYAIDPTGFSDGKIRNNDIVLFRYADVLLSKAEALLKMGLDPSEPLNAVRARAGEQAIEATEENILQERLRELAWEGWRRQDMIRFGTFTLPYTDRPTLPAENTGFTTIFPIPRTIIEMNPNLKQNRNYN